MATKRKNSRKREPAKDDLVFKALANSDRREMLDQLKQGPQTTGQLCDRFDQLDRCTVMLHLKTLAEAELIIAKKKGRHRWNYLNVVPIQRVYQRWIHSYAQPAAELLASLKSQLENE